MENDILSISSSEWDEWRESRREVLNKTEKQAQNHHH